MADSRHDPTTTPPSVPVAGLPAGRAFLAVRRSAGAADRRGARAARSGAGGGALRHAAAAVFRVAGVPGVRRAASSRRALELARASARVSARSAPAPRRGTAPASIRRTRRKLRDLFEIVGRLDDTEVLIDDRPVPYARELWLPLVWFLISGDRQSFAMAEHTDVQTDLQALAADLKRLEAEYNMFFAGRLPRPPWETRGRVEALIKR